MNFLNRFYSFHKNILQLILTLNQHILQSSCTVQLQSYLYDFYLHVLFMVLFIALVKV